ncbi:MAG: hypothetical protein K6E30_07980 [Lachnospiraceae bacterium]|nr:hypothetical protein [Lachnospiraceae bacterium]
MGKKEMQAQDLEGLIANLNLHSDLAPDSSFYVDVDRARNAPGDGSVRQKIVRTLRYCAEKRNTADAEEFYYEKLLLAGHRASGKTTELRKIADDLKDQYHVIYIPNIEQSSSRFNTEQDFLYYLMDYVIASVKENEVLSRAVVRDVERLYRYLEDSIFSVVQEERLVTFDHSYNIDGGAEAKVSLFAGIGKVFMKLGAKAGFDEQTKETLTKSIRNNFQEFMDYANSIFLHINTELHKQGKMLLLILDGLDKLEEEKAMPLFLNSEVMLPRLSCSMIVTFPIYLLYSPNRAAAIASYQHDPYVLSMIKVHDRDGKPYRPGIEAMREIAEKRFNTEKLLSPDFDFANYPEAKFDTSTIPDYKGILDAAIMMSGGSLRDFFRLFTTAAENVVIFGGDKIRDVELINAMNAVRTDYARCFASSYAPLLKEILDSKEKDVAVRATPQDDTLLNIFSSGILIEYNGVRWCDVHPLALSFVKRQIALYVKEHKKK